MKTNADPLVVDHLTVRYGKTTAVDDVSFSVAKGEVCTLLGRNGAGKSSTISCLVGQRKAVSGECRIFGMDAWSGRRHLMARVGVVPETPDIPPGATAREIGQFLGRVRPVWNAGEYEARLDRVSVPVRLPAQKLSKGQRRQLALAAALAAEPEVLILDDPTLGLDAVVRRTLFEELVGELADRGITVLVATHDLTGIEGIADHVGIMQQGRLVHDETMDELKGRFRRLRFIRNEEISIDAVRDALGHLDVVASRFLGAAVDAVIGLADQTAISAIRDTAGISDIEIEPLSLEEIFVALCGDEDGGA